jgi:hypothetical protein
MSVSGSPMAAAISSRLGSRPRAALSSAVFFFIRDIWSASFCGMWVMRDERVRA